MLASKVINSVLRNSNVLATAGVRSLSAACAPAAKDKDSKTDSWKSSSNKNVQKKDNSSNQDLASDKNKDRSYSSSAGSSWKSQDSDSPSWKKDKDSKEPSATASWNQSADSSSSWNQNKASGECKSSSDKDKVASFGSYAQSQASGNISESNPANRWKGSSASAGQSSYGQRKNDQESAKLDQWQMEAVEGDRKWQEESRNRSFGFQGRDSDQSYRQTQYGVGLSEGRGSAGAYAGHNNLSSDLQAQDGWNNPDNDSHSQWRRDRTEEQNYRGAGYGQGQSWGQSDQQYQPQVGQNWSSQNSPQYGYSQGRSQNQYGQKCNNNNQSQYSPQQQQWQNRRSSYDSFGQPRDSTYLDSQGRIGGWNNDRDNAHEWELANYGRDYQRGLSRPAYGQLGQFEDRDDYSQQPFYGQQSQAQHPQRGSPAGYQQQQYGGQYGQRPSQYGGFSYNQQGSRFGESGQYGGGLNYQSRRWSSPNLQEQYGSSAATRDLEGNGGSATCGMSGNSSSRGSSNYSNISPSEYQKVQESFGTLGSYGASSSQPREYSSQSQTFGYSRQGPSQRNYPGQQYRDQSSQPSFAQNDDAQGQFRQNRASNWNQQERGVEHRNRNLDEQNQNDNSSRQQAKEGNDNSDTLMEKVKDKMGEVKEKMGDAVEKVEDMASSAWDKISGKDVSSAEKK